MSLAGTSYFINLSAALKYYKAYGLGRKNVLEKLTAGEIHVGVKPPCRKGWRTVLDIQEGRYYVRY